MEFFLFLSGLCVGSFVNVLADRLPRNESVLFGRSHCDYCHKTLRWFELLPVVSYLLQRGTCLRCHKSLSVQYPIVEGATGILFVLTYRYYGGDVYQFISLLALGSALLALFIADIKYMILPDSLIVASGVAVIGYRISLSTLPVNYPAYLLSAAVSFAFFYLIWRVTRGRGMGFGDVKFAPIIGLFLGYPLTVIAFYIAFLTGAAAGVILMLGGRVGWKSHIAFGPFLILGLVGAFIWQQQLMTLWNTFL